jgi:integrase
MGEEKNRKMQRLTKADIADMGKLQGLVEAANTPRERVARQFVIDAFRHKMSSLIPFAFNNESILKIAGYLLNYTIGSRATLYQYVFGVYRFYRWLGKNPDDVIREVILDKAEIDTYLRRIEEFIGDLRAEGLAPGTINNHVKGVKALFKANRINLVLPHRLSKRVKYPDRAPTPEELTKITDLADIRGKVIVSMMALGGFRVGTLVKLQYRHIKRDLEAGVVPVHIHVEAEITKGKYHSYDTFIGPEAVNYLKAYLNARRQGSIQERMPPEEIENHSPLIRDKKSKIVKGVTTGTIHRIVNDLYVQAGIIEKGGSKRYELRPHSIRKYFRTQLGSLATFPTDYIEYMMRHSVSIYNDIRMKGVEYLRNLYASSGLSMRPKTKLTKIDQLKAVIRAWGLDPNEILSKEALSRPHRTVVDAEQSQIQALNEALKQAIIKEFRG